MLHPCWDWHWWLPGREASEGSMVSFLPLGLARYGGAPGGDHCPVRALVADLGRGRRARLTFCFVEDLHGLVVPGPVCFTSITRPKEPRGSGLNCSNWIQVAVFRVEGSEGQGPPQPLQPAQPKFRRPLCHQQRGRHRWTQAGKDGAENKMC